MIGENILLKKSAWMALAKHEHSHLIGYTHPSGDLHSDKMSYGKYGVLMAVTKDPNVGELPKDQSIESMGRQLCQHVIGMYYVRMKFLKRFNGLFCSFKTDFNSLSHFQV